MIQSTKFSGTLIACGNSMQNGLFVHMLYQKEQQGLLKNTFMDNHSSFYDDFISRNSDEQLAVTPDGKKQLVLNIFSGDHEDDENWLKEAKRLAEELGLLTILTEQTIPIFELSQTKPDNEFTPPPFTQTIIDFVKSNLPPSIYSQLD